MRFSTSASKSWFAVSVGANVALAAALVFLLKQLSGVPLVSLPGIVVVTNSVSAGPASVKAPAPVTKAPDRN